MKKLLALMLAAALALSLAACGGGSEARDANTPNTGNGDTTSTDTPRGEENSTPAEISEPNGLKVGDTTTTDSFAFTLTSVEFANELNTDTNDETFMLPLAEGENSSGKFQIKATDGNILLTFAFTYHYIGKDGTNDPFHRLGTPCVSYGDGYTFDGSKNTEFVVIGRTDTEDAY